MSTPAFPPAFIPCRTCKVAPGAPCQDRDGRVHPEDFHPTRKADAELAAQFVGGQRFTELAQAPAPRADWRLRTGPICGKSTITARADWQRSNGRLLGPALESCQLNEGHPGSCAWWPTCGLPLPDGGRCDLVQGHGPSGPAGTPCRSSTPLPDMLHHPV